MTLTWNIVQQVLKPNLKRLSNLDGVGHMDPNTTQQDLRYIYNQSLLVNNTLLIVIGSQGNLGKAGAAMIPQRLVGVKGKFSLLILRFRNLRPNNQWLRIRDKKEKVTQSKNFTI